MRYSKRKLKGLPVPKEIKITSLAEYIKVFANERFFNCLFRGEPTNYHDTTSSALRKYTCSFANPNPEYPFIKMKNEFKKEIWHKVSQDVRADFLPFAQHHGAPTNLIDFTKSPLIALYFACQPYKNNEDSNMDENRGFVNIIKNKLIDITDIVVQNEDKNILEQFIYDKNNTFKALYFLFYKYNKEYPYDFYVYFKQLNEDWHYYFGKDSNENWRKKYFKVKFPSYNNGDYSGEILDYYKDFEKSDFKIIINELIQEYGEVSFEVLEYTLKLQDFLKLILERAEPVHWINCIPNFIYSPILTFERGRNQQGRFIYQTYLSFNDPTYHVSLLAQQRTWPDTIIVVENKNQILKELDFLGINRKFVFCDYDNIAAYIKEKF